VKPYFTEYPKKWRGGPDTCPDCGSELDNISCPVCDPWLKDDFDDDFE
jgi:hypothetical protein